MAYPPFTNVTNAVLKWTVAVNGFSQTPPNDLDEFCIGKVISMTLRRSGEMCVLLRPEYGRCPQKGRSLQKIVIEDPNTNVVLDTYYFRPGSDGYDRLSKEWNRYKVYYPSVDELI